MKGYFRGELITKELYKQAYAVSNMFYFIEIIRLGFTREVYYQVQTLECESFNDFPKLFGFSPSHHCYATINAYRFRGDNIEDYYKPNYAFATAEDCREACLRLKLLGHEVEDFE